VSGSDRQRLKCLKMEHTPRRTHQLAGDANGTSVLQTVERTTQVHTLDVRDLAFEFGAKPQRIMIATQELRENRPIQQPIVDDRHVNTLVRHGRTSFLSVHGSGAVTAASEPAWLQSDSTLRVASDTVPDLDRARTPVTAPTLRSWPGASDRLPRMRAGVRVAHYRPVASGALREFLSFAYLSAGPSAGRSRSPQRR